MNEQLGEPEERARPRLLSPGSPMRATVRAALLILLAYAVLGAVAGVVWEWVWTPPGQIVQRHQVFYDSYASLRRVFTGTGLYVLVGAAASALLALAVALLTRGRELLVLALVVVGSAIAAVVMLEVGTRLGPSDPATIAAHTTRRTLVPGQLTVEGKSHFLVKSPYLIWPMTSLFVLALIYFAWPGSHARHGHEDASHAARRDQRPDGAAAVAGGHHPSELPTDRQRLVDEIRSVQFKATRIRQGYEMTAVDRLLDRAGGVVTRGEPLAPLLDTELPTVSWRQGYDMSEVAAFLESLRESADAMDARG